MTATGKNIGLVNGYANNSSGWGAGMNAVLRLLDTLCQANVINSTTATPPSSPAEGDAYIIAASPTGAWSGNANGIARWSTVNSAWDIETPQPGWSVFDVAYGAYRMFIGGSWTPMSVPSAPGNTPFCMRNRAINGDMRIDQRHSGASQSITTGGGAQYTVDRFYATCTGANVTGQQVAGSGVDQFLYKLTGAASVTGIAFGQRFESTNVWDLNSTTVTFSVDLANSVLTTVTWTAYYPTATDNWASRTSIASGTFTVSSTLKNYSTTISLPSNVTAGLEIELSVGAQTSGTWQIGEFQLEAGSVQTPFERRPIGLELDLCQRYTPVFNDNGAGTGTVGMATGSNGTTGTVNVPWLVTPRVVPTGITLSSAGHFVLGGALSLTPSAIAFSTNSSLTSGSLTVTVSSGWSAGYAVVLRSQSTSAQIIFTGCEL